MPAKNRVKHYVKGGMYHIYNKGIEGREIFRDENDFQKFEQVLEHYLSQYEETVKTGFKPDKPSVRKKKEKMILAGEVKLVAYCLMSDHLHLLIEQSSAEGIIKFMRRVMTGYVMYFNKKYRRSGPLFENVYRGILVPDQKTGLLLTKYIHLNPVSRVVRRFGPVATITGSRPEDYPFSSYSRYIGKKNAKWISPLLLGNDANSYRRFVEEARFEADKEVKELLLDDSNSGKYTNG